MQDKSGLKLNRLCIERQQWGVDKDKLFGEIAFENQYSKVTVKLTEEKAYQMLEIVAANVVENAHETANLLIAQIGRPAAEIEGEIQ